MVTWPDLLSVVAILAGIVTAVIGCLAIDAAGMSDAPSADDGNGGCIAVLIGLVLIVAGVVGLIL